MMPRQQGFTLVEVLSALAISGILISLAYGAVVVVQRSAEAVYEQAQRTETLLIARDFIHRTLQRTQPFADPDNPGDLTGFTGARDALHFVTDLPPYVGLGGLMHVDLDIESENGARRLRLRLARHPPADDDTPAMTNTAILLDHVSSLQIRYLGQMQGDYESQWQEQWEGQPTLPAAVRLAVGEQTGRQWPMLTVRLLNGSLATENTSESNMDDPSNDELPESPDDESLGGTDAS